MSVRDFQKLRQQVAKVDRKIDKNAVPASVKPARRKLRSLKQF